MKKWREQNNHECISDLTAETTCFKDTQTSLNKNMLREYSRLHYAYLTVRSDYETASVVFSEQHPTMFFIQLRFKKMIFGSVEKN